MNIRIETKVVKYRLRGVPIERLRVYFSIGDDTHGSFIGYRASVESFITTLEAGARACGFNLDIINDTRQDRPRPSV